MVSQLASLCCRPNLIEGQRPLAVAAKRGRTVISAAVASDTFCKDVVNVRKETKAEGSAMVTFMGAEGSVVTVECPKDTYILDAGLDAGLDLPYTCRGGICGFCTRARSLLDVRKAAMTADMLRCDAQIDDIGFVIDEAEQAQGMALLCMARPLADCSIETQSDWGYSLGVGEWKGASGHILGREIDPLMGAED